MISAFFALALTGRLETPTILIFSAAIGVSCYRVIQRRSALLSARGAFLLSLAYIFVFLFDFSALSRSFISACIHLVLFLQIVKLYQEKSDRDYFYLIVLSFMQVLAASSLTVDMSFVVTLFLFLVALVSTLMSFDMYRAERENSAHAKVAAIPLGGMSLWATVWIILTGVILFLIIPRVGTGYFTQATTQSLLVSGFTDSVQLGEIGQVKLSDAVVGHARQISGTPFALLKWRGIALDDFDGRNWSKTDRKHFPLRLTPDEQHIIHPVQNPQDVARYEILLEPLATNTLFAPYQVRAVSGSTQDIEYDNDDSIYLRFPTARRLQYQVLSEIPNRSRMPANGSAEEKIPNEISARYLQLPLDIDPRVEQLGREITEKGKSTFDKALLVEGYLKRHYGYTLDLTWKPGPQPLSTFLFDAKAGHCEYFASAMAILLRAAGIPTRLINGFLMGEYNPVGHDYIIRQSDAHSWIEVYIPGRGWTEFDPTPPDPNHREIDLARQLAHYVDAIQLFWNAYIIVYDSGAQLQLFKSAQDRMQLAQAALSDRSEHWIDEGQRFSDGLTHLLTRMMGTSAFWAVSIGAAVAGSAYTRRRTLRTHLQIWRIRRGYGAVDEEIVEQLFYRAAHLAERGVPGRKPAETWREWIFGLPDPHRQSILKKALEVFERSKYGRMPVSENDFTALENLIQELKRTT
jgi:hypothetical protein